MQRWRWKIPLAVLAGLMIWWALIGLQKQVLLQDDKPILIADRIWSDGGRIFYSRGKESSWIDEAAQQRIVDGSWKDISCYRPLLSAHLHDTLTRFANIILPNSPVGDELRLWLSNSIGYLARTGTYVLFGLLIFLLFKGGRHLMATRGRRKGDHNSVAETPKPRLAGIADIEAFFLELFREKIDAAPQAPSRIEVIQGDATRKKRVVVLKIKHEGNWRSRRMTIAPIGEQSGSKSQCFYVIYDTYLVVKIPPSPIKDFENYISRLRAEARIMRRLAPRECVIPNISVVLKKIHAFPGAGRMSTDNLEEEYIRWLRVSVKYQRFLKVAGSFVFFMDLSQYYFLSHISESFHRTERLIEKEINADTETISDVSQFEFKYRQAGRDLWPDLNRMYKHFKKELSSASLQAEENLYLSDWQIAVWFLSRMAGIKARISSIKVSERFNRFLGERFAALDGAYIDVEGRYRQLLEKHAGSLLNQRYHVQMSAMATNLLTLLTWLEEKQVAMRDLKPDNLLLAGDTTQYPHFLKTAKSYSIGLIDLETAVDYRGGSHLSTNQPMLGGTPHYATPSHFLPNKVLHQAHKDLTRVFAMQDWHAVVAIVYEIITGDKLFKRTARQIPALLKDMRQAAVLKKSIKEAYARFADRFWQSASIEIEAGIQQKSSLLKNVRALVPATIQQQIKDHIEICLVAIGQDIETYLNITPAFNRGSNRLRLQKSDVSDLERLRSRYENHNELISSMDHLINLKKRNSALDKRLRIFQTAPARVTADVLLEEMFAVVDRHLRPEIPAGMDLPEYPTTDTPDDESTEGLGFSVTVANS